MVKPIQEPPPSARRSRGDTALVRLRRDILLGRYRPGTRLPPERELAARLGTNRNTLREAMRTLESENLVRARQGDGTIVLDWRRVGEITLLPSFLAEDTPATERFQALVVLLNLRERLMDEVVERACHEASADELDAVRGAIDQMRQVRGTAFVAADVEFYRRLALASHSTVHVWVFNTFAKIFLELGERFPNLWQHDEKYFSALERVLTAMPDHPARARDELLNMFSERTVEVVKLINPDGTPIDDVPRRGRARGTRR